MCIQMYMCRAYVGMMAFFVRCIVFYVSKPKIFSQVSYLVNSVVELISENILYLRSDLTMNWEVIQILTFQFVRQVLLHL